MSINGKTENITLYDLEVVAKRNDIHDYKLLLEQVRDAISNFTKYAIESDIDNKWIDLIRADLRIA